MVELVAQVVGRRSRPPFGTVRGRGRLGDGGMPSLERCLRLCTPKLSAMGAMRRPEHRLTVVLLASCRLAGSGLAALRA